MREPVFAGTCTALVTPFDKNGAIDFDSFDKLIGIQLDAGVDALCVCGTTGESPSLSYEEHTELVAHCVKRVDRRVKVIAGAGSNNTHSAVKLSQNAQNAGADALLVVTPYYNKATQDGLIRHYTYIADRVDLPIILYNVPSRTGVSFTAETYRALSENPKINGVKEASGNLALVTKTRSMCSEDFHIWSGNDDQVVPLMSLGAQGVISAAANIVPDVMTDMARCCQAGDFTAAADLQVGYAPLLEALYSEVNPIPIKAALALMGICGDTLRLPLSPISAQHKEALQTAMERVGLL